MHLDRKPARHSRRLIASPISAVSTALRLGESAGTFWRLDDPWSPALERRLRDQWEALRPDVEWTIARPIVRQGWDLCRASRRGGNAGAAEVPGPAPAEVTSAAPASGPTR